MDLPVELSPERRRVIEALLEAATSAFGPKLRSVILYGSAAENRLRATSDINLLFVLSAFDSAADAFREPFRFSRSAANVAAMFVLERELRGPAAEAFAQKFADIRRRHVVLYGDDLVRDLEIPRAALVLRLQQVLLNLNIRLRELYIERSLREEQCAVTVAESAGPLRTAAVSILELEGRGTMPPREALETLVAALGRPELLSLLPHISEARQQRALPAGQASSIFLGMLDLTSALCDRALRLEP